jgi:hypothetical protein
MLAPAATASRKHATELELRRCFLARLVPKPKHDKLDKKMISRRLRISEKREVIVSGNKAKGW